MFFFSLLFSVHVASRCWIYPASSLGRRYGRAGYDSLLFFSKLCFLPPRTFFVFLISRASFRDLHCCNAFFRWSFYPLSADLDGSLCSSMIPGSVYGTPRRFISSIPCAP